MKSNRPTKIPDIIAEALRHPLADQLLKSGWVPRDGTAPWVLIKRDTRYGFVWLEYTPTFEVWQISGHGMKGTVLTAPTFEGIVAEWLAWKLEHGE